MSLAAVRPRTWYGGTWYGGTCLSSSAYPRGRPSWRPLSFRMSPIGPLAEPGRPRCDVGYRRETGSRAALAVTAAFDPLRTPGLP